MSHGWAAAGACLLALVLGSGTAAAQPEHVGKLNPSLLPAGTSSLSATLLPAQRADQDRLPSAAQSGLVMTGVLPVSWHPPGIAVALVEPGEGSPAIYADLDGDGRWASGERLASSPRSRAASAPPAMPSEALIFHLPLPQTSPWPDLPLVVRPFWNQFPAAGVPDGVRIDGAVCVGGDVAVGGRKVMVRLCDNVSLDSGTIDPTHGLVGMDTDGNGTIDRGNYSFEIDRPNGNIAVFAVGAHFVSVKVADARTGTLVLRDHPPSEYTRIRFEVGLEVPDFSFVDFGGTPRRLSEFRGKYLLLQFWGMWCSPCIGDMPGLARVYADYRDRGFEILGLDDEQTGRGNKDPHEVTARARALVAEKGVTWPQARTEAAEIIVRRFLIGIHPTYILLDPRGRIVSWSTRGQLPLRGEALRETLEKVLPKQPLAPFTGSSQTRAPAAASK